VKRIENISDIHTTNLESNHWNHAILIWSETSIVISKTQKKNWVRFDYTKNKEWIAKIFIKRKVFLAFIKDK